MLPCRYKWPKQLCSLFLLFLYLSLTTHIVLFTSSTPWQHLLCAFWVIRTRAGFCPRNEMTFFIMHLKKKNLVTFPLHTHYKSSSFSGSHRLVLNWDKALSWLKEILDLLYPCAILFSSFFSVLMHFQQTTVLCYSPHKSHHWRVLMKKGSKILSAKKKRWFFFLKAD